MNIDNKSYSEEHIIYDENNNVKQIKYVYKNEDIKYNDIHNEDVNNKYHKSEDINNENIKNEENNNIIYYKNELYSTDSNIYDNREVLTSVANGDKLNGYNYIDEEERNKIFEFKQYTDVLFAYNLNTCALDLVLPYPDTSKIIFDNDLYTEKIYYIKKDNKLGLRLITNKKYKYDNNMVNQENWGINGEVLLNNYKKLEISYYENGNISAKKYCIPINNHNFFGKYFYYFMNGGLHELSLEYNNAYLLFYVQFKENGDFNDNSIIKDSDFFPSYNNYESNYKTIKYNYDKS